MPKSVHVTATLLPFASSTSPAAICHDLFRRLTLPAHRDSPPDPRPSEKLGLVLVRGGKVSNGGGRQSESTGGQMEPNS